jgi:hypothetical protein
VRQIVATLQKRFPASDKKQIQDAVGPALASLATGGRIARPVDGAEKGMYMLTGNPDRARSVFRLALVLTVCCAAAAASSHPHRCSDILSATHVAGPLSAEVPQQALDGLGLPSELVTDVMEEMTLGFVAMCASRAARAGVGTACHGMARTN